MAVAIISHAACARHDNGTGHPESPARLAAIEAALDALVSEGVELERIDAPRASEEQLARAHDAEYVATIFRLAPREERIQLDPDTSMGPATLEAALRAAGAAVRAVDLVVGGDYAAAFCPVRPPGHHAERERAMGFCLFDNVAVGAMHALDAHGLERVAVIDFDVHHGNGTEDVVRDDPRIFFASSFQHPFYPFSGASTESEHVSNVPLPAGTAGPEWREAVSEAWFARLDAFAPELVLYSAGFDAHAEDPLGQLELVEDDYAWITARIGELAAKHAGGRIVSLLEGGYALDALGRSAAAHVKELAQR